MVARFHYDRNTYRQFLDDELTPPKQHEVNRHIEGCTLCQAQLEAFLQDDAGWDDLPSLLHREKPTDGKGDTNGKHSVSPAQTEFLAETDQPNSLGRFGRYEIVEVLGHGGMGVVLKGFDPALNRHSAIKVLAPQLATSASARQRFAREAKSAAAVVHEHVVPIQTVDEENGLPYLVMPVVDGHSLQQRVEQTGPLKIKEVLRIGMQIARGLAAAHEQGLVHRDVKPANVLLENSVERVMLTDFGLARAADDANMTQSGVLAGTPQYMSPEQARGSDVDHRSDLFSLGSVLYYMSTGRSPFRAETTMGVLHRITNDDPRPVRSVNEEVPEWLQTIIGRLMAKDKSRRFQTAEEVADVLSEWLAYVQQPNVAAKPTPPTPVPVTRSSRGSSGRVRKQFAVLGGLFLVLAGILITLEWNKGTLIIDCAEDGVPVRITKDDNVHRRLTIDRGLSSTRISAGKYVVEIDGTSDGLQVKDGQIVLSRRGSALAKIVQSGIPTADDVKLKVAEAQREVLNPQENLEHAGGKEALQHKRLKVGGPTDRSAKTVKSDLTTLQMTIRVVDPDGKPIKDATVFRNHVYLPPGSDRQKIENAKFTTDADGTVEVNVSTKSIDLRLSVRKDGYVPLHAMWATLFQADGDQIPHQFTFHLKRGTEIGGVVIDDAGRPISGVTVEVQDTTAKHSPNPALPGTRPVRAYDLATGGRSVVTDLEGRWTLANVPTDEVLLADQREHTGFLGEPIPPLLLRFSHPQYAENDWGNLQFKQNVKLNALRNKAAEIVLLRTPTAPDRSKGAANDQRYNNRSARWSYGATPEIREERSDPGANGISPRPGSYRGAGGDN